MKCDLHIHSSFSDGLFAPQRIVEMAHAKGIDCMAITDHDTVDGVDEARRAAAEVGIKCLVGVELSCFSDVEVHMLGYNMNTSDQSFIAAMRNIVDMRNRRNELIVQRLFEHGIKLDLDKLQKDGTVGRGVMAREMVRLGYCKDVAEVFDKYLGTDRCCFVQSQRLTPVEAVQLVLRYGGIPVLAHPKKIRLDGVDFERFLKPLVLAGLGGIEAEYFAHNMSERRYYGKMAKKYRLVVTGGSDFHDYAHGLDLGEKSFSPSGYTRIILGI